MNREIEFRGKAFTELTDKWVYGNLLLSETPVSGQPKAFIVTRFADSENVAKIEVDPDTVGQYTGKFDINGKRAFEGDIFHNQNGYNCEISWSDAASGFYASYNKDDKGHGMKSKPLSEVEIFLIIGSVH